MLNATHSERQSVVDYLAEQASNEQVTFLQKVYSERLHGVTHDIWDVHTESARWWVITEPINLYSQQQFPNMDLALTFHIGLCLRIPRTERQTLTELELGPLLNCWHAFQKVHEALGSAQEVADYQAIGVRLRECLLSLVHAIQDSLSDLAESDNIKRSNFPEWTDAIADYLLTGASHKARRQLLKSSAKTTWVFVNWLTHSKSAHFYDAEAGITATEQTLNLLTGIFIRFLRSVPDSCPQCGSQRLSPERGVRTDEPDVIYERPTCSVCSWAGEPVRVSGSKPAETHLYPDGDCVIMKVPLTGTSSPSASRNDS